MYDVLKKSAPKKSRPGRKSVLEAQLPPLSPREDRLPRRPGETDAIIGGKIRNLRRLRGLSQEALGSAIGVQFQQIQKYEQGRARIPASAALRMAEALSVPLDKLFHGAVEGGSQEGAEISLEEAYLLKLVRRAPEMILGVKMLLERHVAQLDSALPKAPERAPARSNAKRPQKRAQNRSSSRSR
jgi:transcriptional regulator with XRE-family HTH domain